MSGEPCWTCNGTGRVISLSGVDNGPCWHCTDPLTPGWRPIAEAPQGVDLVLYFPPTGSHDPSGQDRFRRGVPPMRRVDRLPVTYPRQPSHFLALPPDPEPSP